MEITSDQAYTTEEVANLLRTHRNMIDKLRKNGLLNGIKLGKGFIYPAREVNRFFDTYAGMDLSNDFAMQEARRMKGD